MSAVSALIADIKSFQTTHGQRPRKIRMHPFDIRELEAELGTKPLSVCNALTCDSCAVDGDYALAFMGVPVYRADDAVIARPWLDV